MENETPIFEPNIIVHCECGKKHEMAVGMVDPLSCWPRPIPVSERLPPFPNPGRYSEQALLFVSTGNHERPPTLASSGGMWAVGFVVIEPDGLLQWCVDQEQFEGCDYTQVTHWLPLPPDPE